MNDDLASKLHGAVLSDDDSMDAIAKMLEGRNPFVIIPCKKCAEVMIMRFSPDAPLLYNFLTVEAAMSVHEDTQHNKETRNVKQEYF